MRLSFDLKRDSLKAKFIPPDRSDLVYLYDSGADTPVWCKGAQELVDVFPDAALVKQRFVLSGFGKEVEIVDVYRIQEFVLTDGISAIRYQNFIVAVTDRPEMNLDLILPASIFDHMVVTIDRNTSVTYPQIHIDSPKGSYPVFFRQISLTEQQKQALGIDTDLIIQNVYSQEEM